jgi:hypothetical protein
MKYVFDASVTSADEKPSKNLKAKISFSHRLGRAALINSPSSSLLVFAPKGPNNIAQGNALGTWDNPIPSGFRPERAQQGLSLLCPFMAEKQKGISLLKLPGRCPGLRCSAPPRQRPWNIISPTPA